MSAKSKFLDENRDAIKAAGRAIERELTARGIDVQSSTCFLTAIHACAAFAGIPDDFPTPRP